MAKNTNDGSEIEYDSVGEPLNMHRSASYETTLASEILNIINAKNVIIVPGQRKQPVSILGDEFCEKKTFLYLLPKSRIVYNASRDIPISLDWYFN